MIDNLPENITSYAMHVIRFKSDREIHDMVSRITADEEVCIEWKLSEDDYFRAVGIAYFTPDAINITTH